MEDIKKEPTPKNKPKPKLKPKKKAGKPLGSIRVQVQDGVECYLSPKIIAYCKNLVTNGGNKSKAARDAGFSSSFLYSPYFKKNKYIPMYIEKLQEDFLCIGMGEEESAESYVDHIKSSAGKLILKRLVDITNARLSRIQTWSNNGIDIIPSQQLSPEDDAAIESITIEKTEFHGKNPRTTIKITTKLYDAMKAMKEIREMVGINYTKDQDMASAMDQIKDMLVKQKAAGIFPTAPTPETDPSLLLKQEEEGQIPMSDITRH